jgi:DNA adenine methylase
MDPPYWKTENYYSNHDFDSKDHERLANCIKEIKGKFGLSYYDFPLLSEWYPKDQFIWEQKDFSKAASTKKEKNLGTELLIMNY